jgi:NAD+ diphosphatase
VEPGESLEDPVRREVHEETGVRLDEVRYHSSQPWPFPGSIMLGFMAATSTPIQPVHRDELEDARWFERRELLPALEADDSSLRMPRLDSIARRLISDWVAQLSG